MTIEDRDDKLHELYENKELYVFTKGNEWFNNKVKNVHTDYFREQTGRSNDFAIEIGIITWAKQHGFR